MLTLALLAERCIRKAQDSSEFDKSPGTGAPRSRSSRQDDPRIESVYFENIAMKLAQGQQRDRH